MAEGEETFKFSEDSIRQSKFIIRFSMVFVPILGFVELFIYPILPMIDRIDTGLKIFVLIVSTVFTIAIVFIISNFNFKKLRELEVKVTDNEIIRTRGDSIDKVGFDEINKIEIRENKSGSITLIKLLSKSKPIDLAGFENMNLLFERISQNVADESIIHKKNRFCRLGHAQKYIGSFINHRDCLDISPQIRHLPRVVGLFLPYIWHVHPTL